MLFYTHFKVFDLIVNLVAISFKILGTIKYLSCMYGMRVFRPVGVLLIILSAAMALYGFCSVSYDHGLHHTISLTGKYAMLGFSAVGILGIIVFMAGELKVKQEGL